MTTVTTGGSTGIATVYPRSREMEIGVDEKVMDRLLKGEQTWLFVTNDLAEKFRQSNNDYVSLRVRAASGGMSGNQIRMAVRDVMGKDKIPHLATGCSMMVFRTARISSIEKMIAYLKAKKHVQRTWAALQAKMDQEGTAEYDRLLEDWMRAERIESGALHAAFDGAESYEKG